MSQSARCCAKIPGKTTHMLWRFAHAYFKGTLRLSIALMLVVASVRCTAQPVVHGFVLPRQLVKVDSGITMNEFDALQAAVAADAKLEQDAAFDMKQFDDLIVTPVALGKAGRGFVVYFNTSGFCGATANCPMALYLPGERGLHAALHFGGWGVALVPSGGTVPDIVSAWNMSAGDQILGRLRFSRGRFSAIACDDEETGPPDEDTGEYSTPTVKPCGTSEGKPSLPTFTPPADFGGGTPAPTYALMRQLAKVIAEIKPAAQPFGSMPVVQVGHWLVICERRESNGECNVAATPLIGQPSGRVPGTTLGDVVVRDVQGSFVAASDTDGGANNPVQYPALILARMVAPEQMKLTKYREPAPPDFPPDPRQLRGEALVAVACEVANPKQGHWPPEWKPDALRVRAIPCSGFAAPNSAIVDTTPISTVQQDGSGAVWAVTPPFGQRLVRWDEDQWSPVIGPIPNSFMTLSPGPDGGALVTWGQAGKTDWRKGDETRPFIKLAGVAARLGDGELLVWDRSPQVGSLQTELKILDANGNAVAEMALAAAQYIGPEPPPPGVRVNPAPCVASVVATPGAAGLTWIWTLGLQGCWTLRGFVTTYGRSFSYHGNIEGLGDAKIVAVSLWPGGKMAVAAVNDGLYLVDPRTFHAERMPDMPGFRRISLVFTANGNGYVMTEADSSRMASSPKRCGWLWRWSEGQWQKVIGGVDDTDTVVCWCSLAPGGNYVGCKGPRAMAETSEGLWLARAGSGLWFISREGEARQIAPGSGLPLKSVSYIAVIGNRLLLVDTEAGRSVAISPAQLLAAH